MFANFTFCSLKCKLQNMRFAKNASTLNKNHNIKVNQIGDIYSKQVVATYFSTPKSNSKKNVPKVTLCVARNLQSSLVSPRVTVTTVTNSAPVCEAATLVSGFLLLTLVSIQIKLNCKTYFFLMHLILQHKHQKKIYFNFNNEVLQLPNAFLKHL